MAVQALRQHSGQDRVALVKTLNGEQMAWNSPWLQALAASESVGTRSLFRIALAAQDNIVYPQGARILAGVTPMVFEGLGHLQLCFAQEVRQWVGKQLGLG